MLRKDSTESLQVSFKENILHCYIKPGVLGNLLLDKHFRGHWRATKAKSGKEIKGMAQPKVIPLYNSSYV